MPNPSYNAGRNVGSVLGDILTGKSREPGKAYYDQLDTDYTILGRKNKADEAFEDAARSRSMNIARDGITADVLARARSGDRAAEAELGAALMRSAQTPNLRNYTGGALDLQELGFRDAAVEAGVDELGAMNANLAGVASGPIKTNVIDGGYQVNPYVAGSAVATPTEEARIGELGERANLSKVKAASGGFAPQRGGGRAKEMTEQEAQAKRDWILAQASQKIESGEPAEFVDAWLANEMVKSGFLPDPQPLGDVPAAINPAKPAAARNSRISQIGGRTVVKVNTPAEAKAAWAELDKGMGLQLPNGTIRYKD